jgi:hypothetical protein
MGMERIAGNLARSCAAALLVAAGLVSGAANATILVAEPDGVVLDTNTGLEWEQSPSSSLFKLGGCACPCGWRGDGRRRIPLGHN